MCLPGVEPAPPSWKVGVVTAPPPSRTGFGGRTTNLRVFKSLETKNSMKPNKELSETKSSGHERSSHKILRLQILCFKLKSAFT